MSKKVIINTLLNNVELEDSYNDTQALSSATLIDVDDKDTLNLLVTYTTGDSEVATSAQVIVWGVADNNNKSQIGTFDLSSGTAVFTPTVFNVDGGDGETTYEAQFVVGITWKHICVQAKESGVVSNKGKISIVALTQ